jgi:hypothetical protein
MSRTKRTQANTTLQPPSGALWLRFVEAGSRAARG